ncbi:MAG TPA: Crp/Fnr family transcriptional regulator [Stellaceae bacterium]|nr:Crp/Fnr family transcriptional regulator [Stellaceae bacterium]
MMTVRQALLPEFSSNRLLATLSAGDIDRLRPHLERIALTQGRTLHKAHAPLDHVYFPDTGIVSLIRPLKDGATIEVGLLGREGMVGTMLLTGANTTPLEAMAQMPGSAWRLPATVLLETMERHPGFKASLFRFAQALLLQIYQSAACNGRHTLEQRLARWLLMVRDRVDRDELPLKHEFISLLLGTRRPSISVAIAGFKAAGLVATGHGYIVMLDRQGLERTACECYRTILDQSRGLMRD